MRPTQVGKLSGNLGSSGSMYWLRRYLVFILCGLSVAFGGLIWGDVSKCGSECMFSGIELVQSLSAEQLFKFTIFISLKTSVLYFPLMLVTWLLVLGIQRTSSTMRKRPGTLGGVSVKEFESSDCWSRRRVFLLRDAMFTMLFLSTIALFVFLPSSRLSYSLNGNDLIINGALTPTGFRYYLYVFLQNCAHAFLFLIASRIMDATPRTRDEERR